MVDYGLFFSQGQFQSQVTNKLFFSTLNDKQTKMIFCFYQLDNHLVETINVKRIQPALKSQRNIHFFYDIE